MRSISFFFISFLLLASFASAEINIDTTPSVLYNYGDKVIIAGQVQQETSQRAHLRLSLECGQSIPLSTKIIDLEKGTPSPFSQLVVIPEGQAGTCTVKVTLFDQTGTVLEEKNSNEFVVTSDLKGSFDEARNKYQLGEKLDIKSIISKYNNQVIDGVAVLKFNKANVTIGQDTVPIKLGALSFSKDLSLLPPGEYAVDIDVKDNDGNQRTFTNAYIFLLEGDVEFAVTLEKKTYKPSETLLLSGNVKSKSGSLLKDTEIDFFIDDKKIGTKKIPTSNDYFKFTYTLPGNIKTGNHFYILNARDIRGNLGATNSNFTIQAIPTTLSLKINQTSLLPKEKASFNIILLDQAGDPMIETVNVLLLTAKGETKAQKLSQTNAVDTLEIPPQSLPGNWKLRLEGFGLTDEKALNIREQKSLEIKLDGQELVIRNNGNVKFKEFLQINTPQKQSGKNLNLDLDESTRLKLTKLFDPGNYTLTIPLTGDTFSVDIPSKPGILDGVSDITGNVIGNFDSPARKTFLILAFLALIVALIILLKPHNKRRIIQEDIVMRPRVRRENLQDYPPVELKKEEPKSKYGIADEKDIEDFKRRMKKMLDEEERNKQRNSYGSSSNSGNPPPAAFDMFK